MMGLTDMFGGFRQENINQRFLDISMEALENADQRDMNINVEKNKKGVFTDATGEAIDLSKGFDDFDDAAEEAFGPEIANQIALEDTFDSTGNLKSGNYEPYNKVDYSNDDMGVVKAKQAAQIKNEDVYKQKHGITETAQACTCGECEECKARMKATEEWEFDEDNDDIDSVIDSIPESDVEECVESFDALDDSNDGTRQQQLVRESLSAQLSILLPDY